MIKIVLFNSYMKTLEYIYALSERIMTQTVAKTKSGKPISKKPSVKNTIKKPQFQVLEGDLGLKVLSLVKEKLSKAFPKKPTINWRELQKEKLTRKLKKEKARKMKLELTQKYIAENAVDVNYKSCFVLGFNKVVKNLQTNLNTDCIIVSSNFPDKLSHVLVPLCKVRNVRLVGIDKLDVVTRESLGFTCSVMAILTSSEHSVFTSDIVQKIRSIEMDSNDKNEKITVSKSESESTKTSVNLMGKDSPPITVAEKKKPTNLLLKRSSKNARIFSPPSTSRLETGEAKTKMLKSSNNTLGFSNQSKYFSTQM